MLLPVEQNHSLVQLDIVDANRYTVVSYTDTKMTIRGILTGTGGQRIEIKLKKW
jgi:hypothetical protein